MAVGLVLALIVASLDVARLLTVDDPPLQGSASTAEAAPPATVVPTIPVTTEPPPPPITVLPTASEVGAAAKIVEPDATPPAPVPVAPPTAVPVVCQSDLPLTDSPDVPFNFLCTRGGTPLSWPTDQIKLYTEGLSPEQTVALQIALAHWQTQGRFTVTTVDSPTAATVTMSPVEFTENENGHAQVHYTCRETCAFDRAVVHLSSKPGLTQGAWISTILHELGHVAGLSHVSRPSEVMYQAISSTSPLLYGSGDVAGLNELANVRSR
jgi:predicted Zn-dependent protease